jgi:hypothetical protein
MGNLFDANARRVVLPHNSALLVQDCLATFLECFAHLRDERLA